MKKQISLLLAALLLLTLLVGCGGSGSAKPAATGYAYDTDASTAPEAPMEQDSKFNITAVVADDALRDAKMIYRANIDLQTTDYETSEAAMNTYGYEMKHFSKEPLYDQNGVKLRSSGIMTNQDGGTALLLELENTTDSMVYLSTSDIALNGLLLNSSTWSSDAINPGKRGIVTVELSAVLDPAYWGVYGITDVASVSLSLGQRSEKGMEIAGKTPVEIVLTDESTALDMSGTEVYNSNGLRIITKAVMEDASDYGADLYVLLLAENHSGKTLTIADVYDSLSVNGVMTDYSYYSQELGDGASAALIVKLWESSLEENQITSPADIQEIEVSFEIKDGCTAIDEPTLTLTFEK